MRNIAAECVEQNESVESAQAQLERPFAKTAVENEQKPCISTK